MKIVDAGYEILDPLNGEEILKKIERVARVCYKSEDKITEGSAEKMVRALIKSNHMAMLEHYSFSVKFICDRGVSHLHKSIISNISNSKSTLDLAPRGFGKSTVGDVDYCITRILRDPNIRIMIGSKTQTQAEAFLKEVRTHFEQNEDLIRIFGDWKTSKDNVWNDKQTIKLPKEEWVYVENALPPIVTQEEWDLICKIHEERVIATGSDRRGKKTSGYSFSGKLVCGICGAPYWRKQRVSKDEYWVCSTKQTKGRRTRKRDSTMGKAGEINPLGCDNENISYNSLMEIMGVVSERLQANTDTIKQDMINWLTKLRKQLIEANGGHTEADLQRELSRKSKLLDAYLDGILNKQEYQTKAEELDERIIQLKAETEKNKANSGDIAEIDKVLANIDEEVSRYVDGNEKLKVEYLLEHLEQVQIFPDKVIVIVPILSEGIVVEKAQYVSREKWRRKEYNYQADSEYDPPGWRKHFYIRKRECDRDAVIEGRYRRCVG